MNSLPDDWATAAEVVDQCAQLGSTFGGTPVNSLSIDEFEDFRARLSYLLAAFAKGRILRTQPKQRRSPNLRIPHLPVPSYQLSNIGRRFLVAKPFWRRLYIGALLATLRLLSLIKKYKWVIAVVSAVGTILRATHWIDSTLAAAGAVIAALLFLLIIKKILDQID